MTDIKAAGLDFMDTPISVRERFSFTNTAVLDFLARMKSRNCDAVMLSTCNRVVLWTYGGANPAGLLRSERGEADFFCLEGVSAARYLYEVAAGLRSQVPLEEQILGQLKNALNQARSAGSCGALLDHLFLSAISAGKEVRTRLCGKRGAASVARLAVEKYTHENGDLKGKRALVIGSGEIGMLCARLLADGGARVMMTRRKPRNDGVSVPAEIELIPYEKRYEALRGCDVVMSATACPATVLREEHFIPPGGGLTIFDLAVPRDVAPSIGRLGGVRLFDMDSFGRGELDAEVKNEIEGILSRHMGKFDEWARLRGCGHLFDDIYAYFEKGFTDELERSDDAEKIKSAVRRVTGRLLFTLKDKVEIEKAVELYSILAEAARG